MTNREAFDSYLHGQINDISALDKKEFLRFVIVQRSFYQTRMIQYAAHYGIDIYDVEAFSKWLEEESGVCDV